MIKSVKKGKITFGLINADVKMYVATDSHDLHFHLHHADCLGKPQSGAIAMPRVCKDCDQKVQFADLVSGIEIDDKLVTVDKTERDAVADEQNPNFEVVQFVNPDEVDPILFEATHFLDADKGGEKLYALIRNELTNLGKVGIVQFTHSGKTHMGM